MSAGASTPILWLFRVVTTAHALLLIAQPILAGRFLSGNFSILEVHALVGGILIPAGMTLAGAAVLLWWPGRRPAWPIPVAFAMTTATIIQVRAGYDRELGLHVPLGVGLVLTSVCLAGWAWSPKRRRPMPASPSGNALPPPLRARPATHRR